MKGERNILLKDNDNNVLHNLKDMFIKEYIERKYNTINRIKMQYFKLTHARHFISYFVDMYKKDL